MSGVTYLHLLFDGHEIVHANGAETESLSLGAQALIALRGAARAEIAALLHELRFDTPVVTPARRMLSGRIGRKLAARHNRNGKALIEKSA